jgi:hypothetical protein
MQMKVAEQLFMLSIILELDDHEEFKMLMMMHVHHCMCIIEFFSALNNLLMEITPDQVIPHLVPTNRNQTFDLLRELHHLLEFPMMFVLLERRRVEYNSEGIYQGEYKADRKKARSQTARGENAYMNK